MTETQTEAYERQKKTEPQIKSQTKRRMVTKRQRVTTTTPAPVKEEESDGEEYEGEEEENITEPPLAKQTERSRQMHRKSTESYSATSHRPVSTPKPTTRRQRQSTPNRQESVAHEHRAAYSQPLVRLRYQSEADNNKQYLFLVRDKSSATNEENNQQLEPTERIDPDVRPSSSHQKQEYAMSQRTDGDVTPISVTIKAIESLKGLQQMTQELKQNLMKQGKRKLQPQSTPGTHSRSGIIRKRRPHPHPHPHNSPISSGSSICSLSSDERSQHPTHEVLSV